MSLLALEGVGKRYRDGRRERVVLKEVSLRVEPGELVVVWGERRVGRTTLLRIAAGIEAPDAGRVLFKEADLATSGERTLGPGIGYVLKQLRGAEEQGVLEQVSAALLARGVGVDQASEQARTALVRVDAESCMAMHVGELGAGEAMRVALARTLALDPELLIVDEPAATVGAGQRDELLRLLRALAGQGVAILASTREPSEIAGADRALTLDEGELRGPSVPELAPVVSLRRRGA